MTVNEFIQARLRVKPISPHDVDETNLTHSKKIYVPLITPNGVLVNVEKEVKDERKKAPYTTYSNDFMIKNGVKQLKDVPLSSFAVFDAIKEVINKEN